MPNWLGRTAHCPTLTDHPPLIVIEFIPTRDSWVLQRFLAALAESGPRHSPEWGALQGAEDAVVESAIRAVDTPPPGVLP
jgi:hypothetical protein